MITETQFLGNLKTAALFEGKRYDNPILVALNHAQTHCAICGNEADCENSHSIKKGRGGAAASQVYALPICHSCHVEYETTSIEIYLLNHPNLFEIITRNIEKQFDYFTGEEKPKLKKVKVQQKKKDYSGFTKRKNPNEKWIKCDACGAKTFPPDEIVHFPHCKTLIIA